jgi:hypothetical protein
MGLFSTSRHYHSHDNSTNITFPNTIKVHEHKAPTDESIRIMEDMHDKAIKNIIAKIKVEDNLVNGECFLVDQPWNIKDVKLIFKFKINGKEFTLEREIARYELSLNDNIDIQAVTFRLTDYSKAIMLWYALKMFVAETYEKITNEKFPEQLLK